MIPTVIRAKFVVGQAGFALRALDAFLHTVMGRCRAGELRQWRLDRRVRQVVIQDHLAVFILPSNDHQGLFRTDAAAFVTGLQTSHATTNATVIARFLPVETRWLALDRGAHRVEVLPRPMS